jgi:mRNA interferase RelE/StbE
VTTYRIVFASRARRNLARIDPVIRRRIVKVIDALSTDPQPVGCVPLKSAPSALRIRVGDYRVVYQVMHDDFVVMVADIDHRKDIYRN